MSLSPTSSIATWSGLSWSREGGLALPSSGGSQLDQGRVPSALTNQKEVVEVMKSTAGPDKSLLTAVLGSVRFRFGIFSWTICGQLDSVFFRFGICSWPTLGCLISTDLCMEHLVICVQIHRSLYGFSACLFLFQKL
jgi:hypothetical protein